VRCSTRTSHRAVDSGALVALELAQGVAHPLQLGARPLQFLAQVEDHLDARQDSRSRSA
jgi:hypothetical protein